MVKNGSEILIDALVEQGVDTIFGYPGGAVLNIYDALYKNSDRIHHILTAHEQGAAHAADGYARSTGKVGVCLATSGPGATNLVTGIATAYMDSIPMVAITGNVGTSLIGRDSFQEVYIAGITMPITKHNFVVRHVEELADTVREAFRIAQSGRPGPVLIDIPKDVTAATTEFIPKSRVEVHETYDISEEQLKTVADMIGKAERPFIYYGGGVEISDAGSELLALMRKAEIPSAHTMMAIGCVPDDDELSLGMIGMHGSRASNVACNECDLLIAVGCRFSDRVALDPTSFASQAKIVQIDIDRSEIDKNVLTDHHIVGDAKRVLELLNGRIPQYHHTQWTEYVQALRPAQEPESGARLTPQQVLETIRRLAPQDTIVSTDVGQHQMWSIQHFHFDYPGQLLTSGGFGTMGFGLGAAIGAKQGNPDKTVIHITGDGCFRMNGNELATEAYYGLPVITVIFNNRNLGMVRQWQSLIYDHRYSQTSLENRSPDFVKFADAFGLKGRRVTQPSELEEAITEALAESAQGRGYVIDCAINADEMVHPMVNGGHHITEFLLS